MLTLPEHLSSSMLTLPEHLSSSMLTLPEHLSSSIVCSVLQVIVCLFVFCLDIVSPSSIYGFLLPFGYLQNITIHMLQVDKIILSDTKGQCSNPKKSRNRIDFSKHSCIPHLLRYQQEDI